LGWEIEDAIFDPSLQPGLVSLALDHEEAIEIIKGWSADVRAKLNALHMCSPLGERELNELAKVTDLLPNLRRLSVACTDVDTPIYAMRLAFIGAKLEAMYVNIYSSSLPTWVFDNPFASNAGHDTCKEFAIFCHDCEFRFDYPGMDVTQQYAATADDLAYFIQRSHPRATTLVHDCDAEFDRRVPPLDALYRLILPHTKEYWHSRPATRGFEYLPSLHLV
jgi:hypothetical protein